MQASELLVRRVPIAADDAVLHARKDRGGYGCGTGGVERVVHHRAGLKYPQVPAMPRLLLALHEHFPARLIGMPVRLLAQLRQQRLIQGGEQRRDRLQSTAETSRR